MLIFSGFFILAFFQVILHSQVKASLTIHDAWLILQDGFSFHDGKPTSALFPLVVPAASRTGILFNISVGTKITEEKLVRPDTILNLKYEISGDRNIGSHSPESLKSKGPDDDGTSLLTFKSTLFLERPVLEPYLTVAFLPLPSNGLRVGQLFTMKWRVERSKYFETELMYEVNANSKNWMIAGRKRGYATLSTKQGTFSVVFVLIIHGLF